MQQIERISLRVMTAMANRLSASGAQAAARANTNASSPITIRGISMKTFFFSVLALAAVTVPASAITVKTPANGAQVSSPFQLTASASTCASNPAVSMGYSIDSGSATIVSTSFSAMVSAPLGVHILHVKCWGKQVHDEVLLNIDVVPQPKASAIAVTAPANGAELTSPFNVVASAKTCDSEPAVSMGYSIDHGQAVIVSTSFSAMVAASAGPHVLHVKCWGKQTSDEVLLNVTVAVPVATTATPAFSLSTGNYNSKQSVTLVDATAGATIYYTTDGSAPTTSSLRYSGPIAVSTSEVIEAIAVAPGYASSGLARADYVLTLPPPGPLVPSSAVSVTGVQLLPDWKMNHDPGTIGSSDGTMTLVDNPSLSGQAAKFDTTFLNWGGEIYSRSYATDPNATNFLYDAEVWIEAGSQIGNLEMDNNQVIPNGDTVIYAFQCAGSSNTWDYSENAGTRSTPVVKWLHSSQPCNPADWTPNAWHHVQISYSRDDVGNVTYESVWLDGVEAPINETVPSAFSLHWAQGVLMTNFQVDGIGAGGSSTLYLDNLTIYRW
jgi:hypothetical protein